MLPKISGVFSTKILSFLLCRHRYFYRKKPHSISELQYGNKTQGSFYRSRHKVETVYKGCSVRKLL